MSLLLVDDNVDLRETLVVASQYVGVHRCVTAGSLSEVERKRDQALACSLAVLDINLGWHEPSGIEVYRWLRRAGFAGLAVFLTGHGNSDERVRDAAQIENVQILLKPIKIETLAGLVEEIAKR